jgi:hypothetical protein
MWKLATYAHQATQHLRGEMSVVRANEDREQLDKILAKISAQIRDLEAQADAPGVSDEELYALFEAISQRKYLLATSRTALMNQDYSQDVATIVPLLSSVVPASTHERLINDLATIGSKQPLPVGVPSAPEPRAGFEEFKASIKTRKKVAA